MKGLVKEVPWILVSFLFGISASLAWGIQVSSGDSTLDIHVHDTYFTLNSFEGLFFFISLFTFIIFGFRSYASRMDNFTAFLILCVAGVLLVLALGGLISVIRLIENPFAEIPPYEHEGLIIFPPSGMTEHVSNPVWSYILLALQLFQTALIGFLIYTAYRVGLKIRQP